MSRRLRQAIEICSEPFLLIFPLVQDLVSSGWRRLKPSVSVAIACLAVYWFVQRAFLS
jgi:hypothetical protein